MIKIDAQGRLAHTPEMKMVGRSNQVCEFRLLTTRWAQQKEHVEAVTFFCWNEEAEAFCRNTVKGQLISATGVQETSEYVDANGQKKTFVKYRLTWWQGGLKPQSAYANNAERRAERAPQGRQPPERQDGARPQGQAPRSSVNGYQATPRASAPVSQGSYQDSEGGNQSFHQRFEPPSEHENFGDSGFAHSPDDGFL